MEVDRRPSVDAPQETVLSRREWIIAVVAGMAVSCVAFLAGSFAGYYVLGGVPELTSLLTETSPTVAMAPSPSGTEVLGSTPAWTETPFPSFTPTNTLVVPFLTPGPPATATPQEAFFSDDWEPDDTAEEAIPIEVGALQGHNLHAVGDRDWLYFEAEAGRTYVIETSELGRRMDTVVSLYDGEGRRLASDDDGGEELLASRLYWAPEEAGRLYVMIQDFADAEAGHGTEYDVSVTTSEDFRIDEYEPDGIRARASRIEVGETQRHNRHVSGDEDWISFEAQAGTTYVLRTANLGERADTAIYLYDAQGNELAFDDDSGEELWASRLRWTAPEGGVYYVKVIDWVQASTGPGTEYEVTLRVLGEG
jgi:hypothetical protein